MTEAPAPNGHRLAEYQALVDGAGLVDLGRRTQIELTGADRAQFLHNLCTNEIRKLLPGTGCEAFLTTVQGKTLAHVFVFVCPDSLVLDTVSDQSETILAHLDHYLVCEQVAFEDRTTQWSEVLLAGAHSESLLRGLAGGLPPPGRLAHGVAEVAGQRIFVRRVDVTGPQGFLLSGRDDDVAAVRRAMVEAGAMQCGSEAFEAARIERCFPIFGHDISAQNLPQEIGRDALAISFTKGCYLGQETVARIDALGHVNKLLVGLRFFGQQVPQAQTELLAEGLHVGSVTSAVYAPRLGAPVALGFVRPGHNAPGARLQSAVGEAEVVPAQAS